MLIPRKQKYRKTFRTRSALTGSTQRGHRISFGTYGLKAMSAQEITSRQIEAARRALTRHMKRGGKVWIRIFPHIPITRKAAEVPMGSGKGAVDHYVARVRAGMIIFEIEGVDEETAREAMRLAAHKLPVKTKFITQEIN
ncbi:MAG: 50S ribosomal protein L16 [Candidatus Peregrinibacteria bacterium]|nr:50S ribosomal protein L16 [Candidatus Peregrinibacteria bacterium]